MDTAAAAPSAPARIGDRPLTSGTTMKFVLLIVLILISSGSIMYIVTADWQFGAQNAWGCLLAAGGDPNQSAAANSGMIDAHAAAYRACYSAHYPGPHWWAIVLWPLALAAAGALLFRLLPRWKTRGRAVVPLAAADPDGSAARELERLAHHAGLAAAPRAVVNPTRTGAGALIFGRTGDPTLCLHAGLLVRRRSDHGRFEAVILHEYAHIRNGDITLTYITVALWRAFLAVVVAPYAVWSAYHWSTGSMIYPLWHSEWAFILYDYVLVAILVALVYLARSDVLRSREIYADRAAVGWGADPRQWSASDQPAGTSIAGRVSAAFAALWQNHPSWDLRRNAFTDLTALYLDRSLPMFLTGIAAVFIQALLPSYWLNDQPPTWILTGVTLAAAVLVTGIVGIALWRAPLYAQVNGSRAPSGVGAGLWLGAGAALGAIVSHQTQLTRWLPGQPQYLLVLVLAAGVFAWWITQCARLWIAVTAGTRFTAPAMAFVLASGAVVLWGWFSWWRDTGAVMASDGMHVDGWRQTIAQFFPGPSTAHWGMFGAILVVWLNAVWLAHPVILVAQVLLFLVPISAWLLQPLAVAYDVRREAFTGAVWLRDPPPVRRLFAAGAVGGLACWVAVCGAMTFMHTQRSAGGFPSAFYGLLYLAWVFVALSIGMTVAGTVAASATDRRYSLLVALPAAAVAGLLGFGGWYLMAASDGCLGPMNTMANACKWRPADAWALGGLLQCPLLFAAVAAAVVGAGLAAVLGRLSGGKVRPVRAGTPGRVRLTRTDLATWRIAASAIVATVAVVAVHVGTSQSSVLASNVSSSQVAQDVGVITGSTTTASPAVHELQVTYWYDFGGRDLLLRIIGNIRQLSSATDAAGKNGGHIDPAVFNTLCSRAVAIAADADAYFPVPDSTLEPVWNTAIADTAKAGRDCLSALAAQNGDTFIEALKEFAATAAPLTAFENQIKGLMPATAAPAPQSSR